MNKKFNFGYENVCIHGNWYCKKDKKTHHELYINNSSGIKYCSNCVPEEIKKLAIHINQNRELI